MGRELKGRAEYHSAAQNKSGFSLQHSNQSWGGRQARNLLHLPSRHQGHWPKQNPSGWVAGRGTNQGDSRSIDHKMGTGAEAAPTQPAVGLGQFSKAAA